MKLFNRILADINSEIYDASTSVDQRLTEMLAELILLRWMVAANIALSVAIPARLLVR